MMRPEDRAAEYARLRAERYEWAKQVDPEAVAQYEARVASQIKKSTRIASS